MVLEMLSVDDADIDTTVEGVTVVSDLVVVSDVEESAPRPSPERM